MSDPKLPNHFPSFSSGQTMETSFMTPETLRCLHSELTTPSTPEQLKEQFPGFYNNQCYEVLAQYMNNEEAQRHIENKNSEDQIERIVQLVTQLVLELKK